MYKKYNIFLLYLILHNAIRSERMREHAKLVALHEKIAFDDFKKNFFKK